MLFSNLTALDVSDYSMLSRALSFLNNHDLSQLALGRTTGETDAIYCQKLEYLTENIDDVSFEIHHQYLDFHYILEGEENIDVASPTHEFIINNMPTSSQKDIQFVDTPSNFNRLTLHKGDFVLIGMHEPHRTNGAIDDHASLVKKIVLKLSKQGDVTYEYDSDEIYDRILVWFGIPILSWNSIWS